MQTSRVQLAEIIAEKTMLVSKKELAREIAAYLLAERQTSELDAIMRDVQMIRFEQGIIEGTLECAHDVNGSVLQDAIELLKELFPNAKSYTLHQATNSSLLGGARILLPGQQYDVSLRRKITKLKHLTAV